MTATGRPLAATEHRSLVERYALPPNEIEALSLQLVDEALGSGYTWSEPERRVVQRVVYAAGDPALAALMRFSVDAVDKGIRALRNASTIVVDVRMVEVALDRSRAGRLGCSIACRIDETAILADAQAHGLPRAVAAMRALATEHPSALFVIGNAPTALLALLDLVDDGVARPSLVIGMPVGFVAAAESKAELMARSVPFITIEGRRGGSALAAAATNALLRMASEPT
jgi:precorrin-8X/cobalt-precorrin-8 methylmutase